MNAPRKLHPHLVACALVAIGFSTAAPGVAFAQEAKDYPPCTKKTSPTELVAAKGSHEMATDSNSRGDYDKAIEYWRDAYTFDCTAHKELLNIASAYEKKGDRASALLALETYQQRTGGTDGEVVDRIRNLKAALEANKTPRPAPEAPSIQPKASSVVVTIPRTPTKDTPGPAQGARPYGVAPWIVAGTGGAMAIAGVIMLPLGLGAVSDAKSACGGNVCVDPNETSKGNTGRTEIGVGVALTAVGAAALGGGLAWQFLWNKPGRTGDSAGTFPHIAHVKFTPAVDPHGSGVSLSGSF